MEKGQRNVQRKSKPDKRKYLAAASIDKEIEELEGHSLMPPSLAIFTAPPPEDEDSAEEIQIEQLAKSDEVSDTEAIKEYSGETPPSDGSGTQAPGECYRHPNHNAEKNGYPSGKPPFKLKQKEDNKPLKEKKSKEQFKLNDGDDANAGGIAPNGLPSEVNKKMEAAFELDFSKVKIHKNSSKSSEIDAYAFAQGQNIHFAPGHYQPYSRSGQQLIGHELAHIAQQGAGKVKPTKLENGVQVNDSKKLEREADIKGKQAADHTGKSTPGKKKEALPDSSLKVVQKAAQGAPAPATKTTKTSSTNQPSGPAIPLFTLLDQVLDINFGKVSGSSTLQLDLNLVPLLTAVSVDVVFQDGVFESGLLTVVSEHLPRVKFELNVDSEGTVDPILTIDLQTKIMGMPAYVTAEVTPEGVSGTVTAYLMQSKTITDYLSVDSGMITFNLGEGGKFIGEVQVSTTDGFAAGSASVEVDYETGQWSGVASLTTLQPKSIELFPGIDVIIPANEELMTSFGLEGVQMEGTLNLQVEVEVETTAGMEIVGFADMVIVLGNSGIEIPTFSLTATTTIMGIEGTVQITIDEGIFSGFITIELIDQQNLSSYIVVQTGTLTFELGNGGLFVGAIQVATTDGFATGTANVVVNPSQDYWEGVATLSTAIPKTIPVVPGVDLEVPAGASLEISFGSDGVQVQGAAKVTTEIFLSSDSIQAQGIAELLLEIDNDGITIKPSVIALAITSGLSTPDIDAIVNEGHLTTDTDTGGVLTLTFNDEGNLVQVDLEATGGFSTTEKRIGRISFTGRANLNPFELHGMIHAVSQAELDIFVGEKYALVLVAGSQFFVSLDEQGVSNIDASLGVDLKKGEEAIARLTLIGMLPRGQGLTLMAAIDLLKDIVISEPSQDSLGFKILKDASLGATFEQSTLTQIEGAVEIEVADQEGLIFSGGLSGTIGLTQPDQNFSILTGNANLTLERDYAISEQTEDNLGIYINNGAYISASFEDGALSEIDGGLAVSVTDDQGQLLSGFFEGNFGFSDTDQNFSLLSGSGALTLERDYDIEMGGGVVTINSGSGLDVTFADGSISELGGIVGASYSNGDVIVTLDADFTYDFINNEIKSLDAELETDAVFSLFDGDLQFSELSGHLSIRNNELVSIGGGVTITGQIGDFEITGSAEVTWLSENDESVFIGEGSLTILGWQDDDERDFYGFVAFSINRDEFDLYGEVAVTLMNGLSGAASITMDEQLDPIISATLTYSATVMEPDELWAFDLEFGMTIPIMYIFSIGFGIIFGITINTRPLIVIGSASIYDWRPKEGGMPDFSATLSASWGIDIDAELLAYVKLIIGLDGILAFAAGIRAGIGLHVPIEISPWISLFGADGDIWGEMGLDLSINPVLKLIVDAFMEWNALNIWEGEKVWPLVDQQLGDLGEINWSGSFAFGDRDDASEAPSNLPTQQAAPQSTNSPQQLDGADYDVENNPVNEVSTNEPDAEGGLGSMAEEIEAPAADKSPEEQDTDTMGSETDRFGSYAEGVKAVLLLVNVIKDGLSAFFKGGPIGIIIWIIFGDAPSWSEIKAAMETADEFADQLVQEGVIKPTGLVFKLLNVLSGDYGILDLLDKSKPYRDMIDAGWHIEATLNERAQMLLPMMEDDGWFGHNADNNDEERLITVLAYTFVAEGEGAVRELVSLTGGKAYWRDQFEHHFMGWPVDQDKRATLEFIFGYVFENGNNNGATYTAKEGAYIQISTSEAGPLTIGNERSWEELGMEAFDHESYGLYIEKWSQNVGHDGFVTIPYKSNLGNIAKNEAKPFRYPIPTDLSYLHFFETSYFLAREVYDDQNLFWRIEEHNPDIFDFTEGQEIYLPAPSELGPPTIEIDPTPIGNTGYTITVTHQVGNAPQMWAGPPDQLISEIASEVEQIEAASDAAQQLHNAVQFTNGTSQLDVENAVTKVVSLVEFLLTSELYQFEDDGSGAGFSIHDAQPGDIIPRGDLPMFEIADIVYNHRERAAWIEAHQPVQSTDPPVAIEAEAQGLARDGGDGGTAGGGLASDAEIGAERSVSDQINTNAGLSGAADTTSDREHVRSNNSSSSVQETELVVPPGMLALPTWQNMNDLDALPAAKRGIAPSSIIEAIDSDTWSSLAMIAYGTYEKALPLAEHESNENVSLTQGAEITIPSAADLINYEVAIGQHTVATADGGGLGGGPTSVLNALASDETLSTGVEERIIEPDSKIQAIEGDTWAFLAMEAYGDFSLFPKLANYPANAAVKTLPIGEWITLPTLEDLMETPTFGLGLSPTGKPLLTEMVRIPCNDELHHVWVENVAPEGQDVQGVWMMASDPFDLKARAVELLVETADDPEMYECVEDIYAMTIGEQSTDAIENEKEKIRLLVIEKYLASKFADSSTISASVGQGGRNKKADVMIVQQLLENAEFSPGIIDGKAGTNTINAISSFQQAMFQWQDGLVEVNGKTWDKLSSYIPIEGDQFRGESIDEFGKISSPAGSFDIVNTIGVKVRKIPGGEENGKIKYNTDVRVVCHETGSTPTWKYVISASGQEGWIDAAYVVHPLPEPNAQLVHVQNGWSDVFKFYQGSYTPQTGFDDRHLLVAVAMANHGRIGVTVNQTDLNNHIKNENVLYSWFTNQSQNNALYNSIQIVQGTNIWLYSWSHVQQLVSSGVIDTQQGITSQLLDFVNDFVEYDQIMAFFGNATDIMNALTDDPAQFIQNLVDSVTGGFQLYTETIGESLMGGVTNWLLGDPNLKFPATLDFASMANFALEILGINWEDEIKAVVGEQFYEGAKAGFGLLTTLISDGPKAVLEEMGNTIETEAEEIKSSLIEQIKGYAKNKILLEAGKKILAMFVPGAGILVALQSIWRLIKTFYEQAEQIVNLLNAIGSAMADIANGNLSGAIVLVKNGLDSITNLLVSALFDFLNLGGIRDKIRTFIENVRGKILGMIQKIADYVKGKFITHAANENLQLTPGELDNDRPVLQLNTVISLGSNKISAFPLTNNRSGSSDSSPSIHGWTHAQDCNDTVNNWVKAHKIHHDLGGPGNVTKQQNLFITSRSVNVNMEKQAEKPAINSLEQLANMTPSHTNYDSLRDKIMYYEVTYSMHGTSSTDPLSGFAKNIQIKWGYKNVNGTGKSQIDSKSFVSEKPPINPASIIRNINSTGWNNLWQKTKAAGPNQIPSSFWQNVTLCRNANGFTYANSEDLENKLLAWDNLGMSASLVEDYCALIDYYIDNNILSF